MWPLVARAQQTGKLQTIGFLGADAAAFSPWTAAFVARLLAKHRFGAAVITLTLHTRTNAATRNRIGDYATRQRRTVIPRMDNLSGHDEAAGLAEFC